MGSLDADIVCKTKVKNFLEEVIDYADVSNAMYLGDVSRFC